MARLFLVLSTLDAAALLASYAFGVVSKLGDAVRHPDNPAFLIHFNLGLFTAIGTLLVHCLIFTYFLGTGRWVKEVGIAYHLPDDPLPKRTRELKRRTFPPALFAMLITIATAAAGAGAQLKAWPWSVHATLATLTVAINFWAFTVEYRNVSINSTIIDKVMAEVERIRAEHGLPGNTDALQGEGI
jgi:hypothetical protein